MARMTLNQIDREKRPEPFEFEFPDGAVFAFRDPKGMHYRDIVALDTANPDESMKAILGDQYEAFVARDEVDGYLIEAIMEGYMAHYGLGPAPEDSASSH